MDVRITECLESVSCRDGIFAVRVGAVDDDLGVSVGNAPRKHRRIDGGRRQVDRAGQVRVRLGHRRERVDEDERVVVLNQP